MQKKTLAHHSLTSSIYTLHTRRQFIEAVDLEYHALSTSVLLCPSIDNLESVLHHRLQRYSIGPALNMETQHSLVSVFIFLLKTHHGFFTEDALGLNQGAARIRNLLASEQLQVQDLNQILSRLNFDRASRKLFAMLLRENQPA